MATTAARNVRIEHFLGALKAYVDDFPSMVEEWTSLVEADQVATSLQWDHLMADYLTELDGRYHAGEMGPEQAQSYRHLLGQLKEILPLIHRLNFYRPSVSLDG